jgi:ankyrin repeat protein
MKSTKLQLLVTLVAILTAAGIFAAKGLPPSENIFECVCGGDLDGLRRSLNWGANVNSGLLGGTTLLHLAVEYGHKDIAELLIARGATLEARLATFGWTPLHLAANKGRKDMIALLVAKGAEINAKDNDGRTPLWCALDSQQEEAAELLRQHGATE